MGIIHRDIKPENMLYDPSSDTICISDFNVSYLHQGNAPLERGCVYTKERVGSKPYRAPEIVAGSWYGVMVDWWALGCVMFDLISGEVSILRSRISLQLYSDQIQLSSAAVP